MKQRMTWIFLLALAWLFIGGFLRIAIVMTLQWLPFFAEGLAGLPLTLAELASVVAAGFAAYHLVRLVRDNAGAPPVAWIGVAGVEVLAALPMLVGIVFMLFGARGGWLEFLLVWTDSGPAPLTEQVSTFVFGDVLVTAVVAYAAWRGSVVHSSSQPEACLTSGSS